MRRQDSAADIRSQRGQVIVMVAFATIALFALAGLAFDLGRLYVARAQLGRAVDAAALAGVLEFNGQPIGLTNGQTKAQAYLTDNEPTAAGTFVADGALNTLSVDATKTVKLFFMPVVGIYTGTVKGHAKAGFGTQTVDAALVIDATSSMGDAPCNGSQNNAGCPIWEAKNAAKAFKDILLGSAPSGNVVVGVNPFRGCYRANTQTATAPMPNSKSNCPSEDSQVTYLSSNASTLDTRINAINSVGGSGTNVCGGLSKGWQILEGAGNHTSGQNNRRYVILLSDGDSRYTGSYTYQSSPYDSPHTYQTYPCRPPTSCSNVGGDATGSDPCHSFFYTPITTVASDNFPSACTSWSGGSGWAGAWTRTGTGNDAPALITTSSPNDTSCHVRLQGIGTITRIVNLSSQTTATLRYYGKYNSWEAGDDVLVQVSTNGTTWTNLTDHTTSNTTTSYNNYSWNLDAYVGNATVYIRFEGSMSAGSTGDQFYLDTVVVETGFSGSSNGYINGDDNSNSTGSGCAFASVKRERQLDILTWNLAKAIEADGVEIFVVGFGVCSSNSTTYTQAQCDAQIGNTDNDSTADQRLLKCVASSKPSTNDHYFYASTASALPSIFTAIASQIAHRLVE